MTITPNYRNSLIIPFLAALALYATGCGPAKTAVKPRSDPQAQYLKGSAALSGERYDDAEAAFKDILEEHPLSPYAVEAELLIGDVYYGMGKYDEAAAFYTNFAALHPAHPRASYALFQKGMSYLRGVLTIDRDQTATKKALFAIEDLISAHPQSQFDGAAREIAGFLRTRLAEREFYVGRFYFKGKNYKGALARFRDLLKDYPEAGYSDQALYYIGESYLRLGEDGLAREVFTTLVTDFPESPYASGARTRLRQEG